MTYKEFEEEIKILGLVCEYDFNTVSIIDPNYRECLLARVSLDTLNSMTTTPDISRLSFFDSYRLLSLCFCLSRTIVEERQTVTMNYNLENNI